MCTHESTREIACWLKARANLWGVEEGEYSTEGQIGLFRKDKWVFRRKVGNKFDGNI